MGHQAVVTRFTKLLVPLVGFLAVTTAASGQFNQRQLDSGNEGSPRRDRLSDHSREARDSQDQVSMGRFSAMHQLVGPSAGPSTQPPRHRRFQVRKLRGSSARNPEHLRGQPDKRRSTSRTSTTSDRFPDDERSSDQRRFAPDNNVPEDRFPSEPLEREDSPLPLVPPQLAYRLYSPPVTGHMTGFASPNIPAFRISDAPGMMPEQGLGHFSYTPDFQQFLPFAPILPAALRTEGLSPQTRLYLSRQFQENFLEAAAIRYYATGLD